MITWNGKDVPPELGDLPASRYVVEAIEDDVRDRLKAARECLAADPRAPMTVEEVQAEIDAHPRRSPPNRPLTAGCAALQIYERLYERAIISISPPGAKPLQNG